VGQGRRGEQGSSRVGGGVMKGTSESLLTGNIDFH
jgi:hypothetical protein